MGVIPVEDDAEFQPRHFWGHVRYLCRRSEHAYGSKWFKVFFGNKMKSMMNGVLHI